MEQAVAYLQQPTPMWTVWLIVVAVVIINLGDWVFRRRNLKKRKTEVIIDEARKSYVRATVRDAYVNALYALRFIDKPLTLKEYEWELAKLRRDQGFDVTWRIKLNPRRLLMPEVQRLKAELRQRRLNGKRTPQTLDTATLLKSLTTPKQGALANG